MHEPTHARTRKEIISRVLRRQVERLLENAWQHDEFATIDENCTIGTFGFLPKNKEELIMQPDSPNWKDAVELWDERFAKYIVRWTD